VGEASIDGEDCVDNLDRSWRKGVIPVPVDI
jgi:hypothetical protein